MSTVLCEIKEHIAHVTINRPEALNALSTQVLNDLSSVLDELDKAAEVYAVVLTGAGEKSFVAGADIAEMKDHTTNEAKIYSEKAHTIFSRIENFRCPWIAAVNGFALGGGCELALSCDIRIASTKARFAQPEVGLGITPGFGGTQRLPRLIGTGRAKEMIYTARHVKADEAFTIGLVNKVCEPEALMNEAETMAKTIAKQAPIAVRNAKKAINDGMQCPLAEALKIEVNEFASCFASEDQKMAMTAFMKKESVEKFNNK